MGGNPHKSETSKTRKEKETTKEKEKRKKKKRKKSTDHIKETFRISVYRLQLLFCNGGFVIPSSSLCAISLLPKEAIIQ